MDMKSAQWFAKLKLSGVELAETIGPESIVGILRWAAVALNDSRPRSIGESGRKVTLTICDKKDTLGSTVVDLVDELESSLVETLRLPLRDETLKEYLAYAKSQQQMDPESVKFAYNWWVQSGQVSQKSI